MIRRNFGILLALATILISASCAGATSTLAPVVTTAAATATPVATTTPSATTAATLAWTVSDRSKATIRVREQLAALSFPSDAVLVATGAKGAFHVNDDGTFAPGSQITFDVTSLASDSSQRDSFVKNSVLATRQFPTATLVPTKITGLSLPLPATGTFTFALRGKLTIHGVEKDATFTGQATRSGGDLTATATLEPTFKFGDFGMPVPAAPGRVLSVVDEIKLVVELTASGPKG